MPYGSIACFTTKPGQQDTGAGVSAAGPQALRRIWRPVKSASVQQRGIELRHQLTAGGPGRSQFFLEVLHLQTQVRVALLQRDDLPVEILDGAGGVQP